MGAFVIVDHDRTATVLDRVGVHGNFPYGQADREGVTGLVEARYDPTAEQGAGGRTDGTRAVH